MLSHHHGAVAEEFGNDLREVLKDGHEGRTKIDRDGGVYGIY